MSVIVEKSVCVDCIGRDTCQRLKRLNPGVTIRDELIQKYERGDIKKDELLCKLVKSRAGRPEEIFEIIIVNCSLKGQYSERKRLGNVKDGTGIMYYCKLCESMHNEKSEIGFAHKKHSGG